MFRTMWDIDRDVRYRAAGIAADRRAVTPLAGTPAGSTRLRRAFGQVLIRVGERLAERDAVAPRHPARPATVDRVGA